MVYIKSVELSVGRKIDSGIPLYIDDDTERDRRYGEESGHKESGTLTALGSVIKLTAILSGGVASMKRCFLYPGQGEQFPGMVQDLWNESLSVKELFAEASEEIGLNCTRMLFEGTEEDLRKTENTQVAVTLANLAAMVFLREHDYTSDICAGFSLGEYSALVDSGILDQSGVFRIVRRRGEIMARVSEHSRTGPAGMAAVLGLDMDEAKPVLAALEDEDVYLANHSSPTQIVMAGTLKALDKADILFEKAGALRFVRLKVSGPFHSPLMERARSELAEFLGNVDFHEPRKPVFSNVTGDLIQDAQGARELCVSQIVSPVQWVSTEERIMAMCCEQIPEVGPGKVLPGLWKSFTKKIKCQPAGTVSDISSVINVGRTQDT